MHFDIDIIIISSFLIINLLIGIYYGKGIKTLKYFAIGNRNFNTATITGTIIATWIGAGFFSSAVSETYQNGLWHIVARVGDFLTLAIVGVIIAPRIGEFFGKITVAEIMNDLYGKKVRIITAISSIALSIGYVAVQIKVFSTLFSYFLGIPYIYSVLISSVVIIVYSSFGGILSITFTDLIQVFTFGVFVPIFALFLWVVFGSSESTIATMFATNPLLDYKQIFNYHDINFYMSLMLFIYFTLPALDPVTFQRILMAKNTIQVRQAFIYSSVLCLLMGVMACFIGIIALAHNPNMDPNNLIIYVVDNYSFAGLKGLVLIAIMAMGMSTADSYINASAVIFSNDFCKPLGIKIIENELLLARICSCLIGIIAILFVLFSNSLFGLLLLAGNFYTPIITAPLIMAVFGFRSTSRSVLMGMMAGFTAVIIWRIFIQSKVNIDSIIPGTIVNLMTLLSSHYLLGETGGWVGIKDPKPLIALKLERERKFKQLIQFIKNFKLIEFCKDNLPATQTTYSIVGVFIIISNYSSMYTIPGNLRIQHQDLYNLIYHSVLIFSLGFLTFPVWPIKFKNETFIAIMWNLGIFYMLIFASVMLVIISVFGQMQLMIFILNLVVIGILFRWKSTLSMTIIGILSSMYCFKLYTNKFILPDHLGNAPLNFIYFLLLFSGVLVAFLKPKQQQEERSENLKKYLEEQNTKTQFDLLKLFRHREEFVNRLDKRCIDVFKSIHKQIVKLDQGLLNINYHDKNNIDLIQIINKLKAGAEYLDDVIWNVKNQIKINPTTQNLKQFIYNSIVEYTKLDDIQINIEFKMNNQDLEIDQLAIRKSIITCIKHGVDNSDPYAIIILVENAIIEYDSKPSATSLKIKRNAIKISIIFDNSRLQQNSIYRLQNPKFNSIDEINFAEIHRIINAHYGKMDIITNDANQLIYSITIPAKLKEIRPKIMNLPDIAFEQLEEINALVNNKNKELLHNIAKQLINESVDISIIAKITKLTLQEINEL